jgi:hypothetical protein
MAWEAVAGAAKNYAIGIAAKQLATKLEPTVVNQLLLPMGRLAANVAPVMKPVAKFVGKWGTEIPNPIFEAAKIVMFNPTNHFPGSSAERDMLRRSSEALQRQQAMQRQNAANVALAHANILRQAMAKQAAAMGEQRRNTLQLRAPHISNARGGPTGITGRFEPFKLRPAANISTPFNLRLMHGPVKTNPFGLSVMGRPAGPRFVPHIPVPTLRLGR